MLNDFAKYMETHVQIRRALPFVSVVDELDGMLPRRVAQLRAQAAEGDIEVPGPFGLRPLSKSLPVRVFDLWAHEQDIRRAVGEPPRVDGISSAVALRQSLVGWTQGLPRAELGIDGELIIDVTGPEASTTTITLGEGGPSATLRGDLGQITRAFCGRGELDADMLTGDADVVSALAGQLARTP
ncbi:MAG: maleylpyruvate isomerase family mycothiol-dependent enzyme [Acidimicrobiales bacterium]